MAFQARWGYFWLPEQLELPADRPRSAVTSRRTGSVSLRLDASLLLRLRGIARDADAALSMVVQAGLAALLTRLGAGTDIPIGNTVSGRTDTSLFDVIGCFGNTLVLRPINHWSECKAEFDGTCPIAPWQLRDLRRTFATKLAALRVPPHIIERLLNHKLGTIQTGGEISAVAAVYNRHLYLDEMREAIALWEKHLGSLLIQNNAFVKAA